jgi:hypothetical protein
MSAERIYGALILRSGVLVCDCRAHTFRSPSILAEDEHVVVSAPARFEILFEGEAIIEQRRDRGDRVRAQRLIKPSISLLHAHEATQSAERCILRA